MNNNDYYQVLGVPTTSKEISTLFVDRTIS